MILQAKKRPRPAQSHSESEFLWLVSLSDLMILLFVFFVVLFSFSIKNMSASELIEAVAVFNGNPDTPIDAIEHELNNALASTNMNNLVDIKQDTGELIMHIKDAVLFESGQYRIKENSKALLNSISHVFAQIPPPYHLAIEGHTDDIPFVSRSSGLEMDNWQLSVMRSLEVFRNLLLNDEIKQRTSIVGYGSMKPLVPNHDEKGRPIIENLAKNRRVTMRIY